MAGVDFMERIKEENLTYTHNRTKTARQKYANILEDIYNHKRNNVLIDFQTREEMKRGYNSMFQQCKRRGYKLYFAQKTKRKDDTYRIVISYDRKRKDLIA